MILTFIIMACILAYSLLTWSKLVIRKGILYTAILMYHRDVKRYGGDIYVEPEDIYGNLKLALPWNWRLNRMMPEAKFRIIESYI